MTARRGRPSAQTLRRAADALAKTGTTRCARCGWTFEGTWRDGISASRAHRAQQHPELPERSRPSHKKPSRDPVYADQERRVREALHACDAPTRVGEIARAAGVPPNRASKILRSLPDAELLYSGKWVFAQAQAATSQ